MKYINEIPESVPPGKIVVHNRVRPTMRLGSRGFRAWIQSRDEDPPTLRCDCGWASDLLPEHYRIQRKDVK